MGKGQIDRTHESDNTKQSHHPVNMEDYRNYHRHNLHRVPHHHERHLPQVQITNNQSDNANQNSQVWGSNGRQFEAKDDGTAVHKVQKHETVWAVARDILTEQNGGKRPSNREVAAEVEKLRQANPSIKSIDVVHPGDEITVPKDDVDAVKKSQASKQDAAKNDTGKEDPNNKDPKKEDTGKDKQDPPKDDTKKDTNDQSTTTDGKTMANGDKVSVTKDDQGNAVVTVTNASGEARRYEKKADGWYVTDSQGQSRKMDGGVEAYGDTIVIKDGTSAVVYAKDGTVYESKDQRAWDVASPTGEKKTILGGPVIAQDGTTTFRMFDPGLHINEKQAA